MRGRGGGGRGGGAIGSGSGGGGRGRGRGYDGDHALVGLPVSPVGWACLKPPTQHTAYILALPWMWQGKDSPITPYAVLYSLQEPRTLRPRHKETVYEVYDEEEEEHDEAAEGDVEDEEAEDEQQVCPTSVLFVCQQFVSSAAACIACCLQPSSPALQSRWSC